MPEVLDSSGLFYLDGFKYIWRMDPSSSTYLGKYSFLSKSEVRLLALIFPKLVMIFESPNLNEVDCKSCCIEE